MSDKRDDEENRLSARAARYVRVGTNVGGLAARIAGKRLLGMDIDRQRYAAELAAALGGLKGPIMKVAQLLSTIPEALPVEYAAELSQLQSHAPPMGAAFVRRRMAAELGPDWPSRFQSFASDASASASLGQVHRAMAHDGRPLAVKLQYPDMASAVEADLSQLKVIFQIHRRMEPAVETSEILVEIAERLREELDYEREASHMRLYAAIFAGDPLIHVPEVDAGLSTRRLLTMGWLEGRKLDRLFEVRARGPEHDCPRHVPGLVASVLPSRGHPRRSPSRQLHGLRGGSAGRRASTFSTTAASAHLRRSSCKASSTSIAGSSGETATSSCMPTKPGGSRVCRPR